MNLEELRSLTYDQIAVMPREKVIEALKVANREAKRARTRAFSQMAKHPEMPKPQIFRDYVVGEDRDTWETYKFTINPKDKLPTLRKKLNDTIGFLSSKTLRYSDWKKSFNKFVKGVLKKAEPVSTRTGKRIKLLDIDRKTYGRLWQIYNRITHGARGQEIKQYTGYSSEQLMVMIYEEMSTYKRYSIDRLVDIMEANISEGYEAEELRTREISGVTFTRKGLD